MNEALNLNLSPAELQSVTELALAHVGDAVFELLVRQELCCARAVPVRDLHRSTVARVTAPAQAAFIGRIQPLLTAEETAVYKRGRNAHTHQAPKSATPGQYARATGLETLFGWLWLTGQNGRLRVLYDAGKEKDDAT